MDGKMVSVHDEHRAFQPYLEEMDVLARSIDTIPAHEFTERLTRLHEFAHELMPHAVAEGRILSPLVSDEQGDASLARRMRPSAMLRWRNSSMSWMRSATSL